MEILGLIDTLESMICDSPKIPLTGKTLINESEILSVLDKIRLVLNSDKDFIKTSIGKVPPAHRTTEIAEQPVRQERQFDPEANASDIIEQAYQVAKEIKAGADKYADDVLTNLEATTDRIIRTIRNGKARLTKGSENTMMEPAVTESPVTQALNKHQNIIKSGRK